MIKSIKETWISKERRRNWKKGKAKKYAPKQFKSEITGGKVFIAFITWKEAWILGRSPHKVIGIWGISFEIVSNSYPHDVAAYHNGRHWPFSSKKYRQILSWRLFFSKKNPIKCEIKQRYCKFCYYSNQCNKILDYL